MNRMVCRKAMKSGSGLRRGVVSVLMVLFALSGMAALSGCSTTAGLGQDIQRGGAAIERAAERNR